MGFDVFCGAPRGFLCIVALDVTYEEAEQLGQRAADCYPSELQEILQRRGDEWWSNRPTRFTNGTCWVWIKPSNERNLSKHPIEMFWMFKDQKSRYFSFPDEPKRIGPVVNV